jgi:hypothetical protein
LTILVVALFLVGSAIADETSLRQPGESGAVMRPRLKISLYSDADRSIAITVAQGELVRLRRDADGLTFGLKAAVDPLTHTVVVEYFRLEKEATDVQSGDRFATSRLTMGGARLRIPELNTVTAKTGGAAPYVEIAVDGIAVEGPRRQGCAGTTLASRPLPPIESNMKPNQCCLPCGDGWTACGCAVSCGGNSCCVGECC